MSKKSIKSSKNLRCNSVWNRSGRHHCQVSGLKCLCSCCSCSPVGHLCQVRVLPWSVRVLPQVSQSVIITNLTQLHISTFSILILNSDSGTILHYNHRLELPTGTRICSRLVQSININLSRFDTISSSINVFYTSQNKMLGENFILTLMICFIQMTKGCLKRIESGVWTYLALNVI